MAVGLEPCLHHLDLAFLGRDDPLRQFAQLWVLHIFELDGSGFGFKPQRSDLKTIIATAWTWRRKAHSKRERANSASGSLQGASRQRPK